MTLQLLTDAGGSLSRIARDAVNANFSELFGGLLQVGKVFYCDAVNGNDTANDGLSAAKAFSTLSQAYNSCTAGNNDVVVLIGDGATAKTQRLSAGFTWSKNATHLIGISAPVLYSQRARIAPTSGATAFANFFTVSGNGCIFQNIQFFHGFDTGTTAQICMTVTGSRNYFRNCHIAGMGDQASADDAGSRSLKIGSGGSGENVFEDCVIGLDTVTRGAANASVEFAGATPRNVFRRCLFPFMADAASPLGIKTGATGTMDRFNIFEECLFYNCVESTSTTLTALCTLNASSGGGLILRNCTAVGITDLFSDATTSGQMYIDGAAPTAATSGLAVAPA